MYKHLRIYKKGYGFIFVYNTFVAFLLLLRKSSKNAGWKLINFSTFFLKKTNGIRIRRIISVTVAKKTKSVPPRERG